MTGSKCLKLHFAKSKPLTLGAELELQLLDGATLDLSSSSPEVLKDLRGLPSVNAEIYQSMIEITSGICTSADEVGGDLAEALGKLRGVCHSRGLALASAGTHPFANYQDSLLYPGARYEELDLPPKKWTRDLSCLC